MHEVEHCGAPVGIIACRYAVFGFVEKYIAFALGSHNLLIAFHDIIACDFCSEFGHYCAVDFHFTISDHLVGFTA